MRRLLLIAIIFLAGLNASGKSAGGQNAAPVDTVKKQQEILTLLDSLFNNVSELVSSVPYMSERRMESAEQNISFYQQKWDMTVEMNKPFITEDQTEILNLLTEFPALTQQFKDAIEKQKQTASAKDAVNNIFKKLDGEEAAYRSLYKKAQILSLHKKGTPQLEQLKASEKLHFEELTQYYNTAKQGAEQFPALKEKFAKAENTYIKVSAISKQIQELAYQPFIDRAKNYLIGLGAVAMILMFFNMMITKFKAAKDAKNAMKKYQDMVKQNNNDIPTI